MPDHRPSHPDLQPVEGGDALATDDETIVVTQHKFLDHFQDQFGLTECESLPGTYKEIDNASQNGFYSEIKEIDRSNGLKNVKKTGGQTGIDSRRLKQAIAYCSETETFDPETFTLWQPDRIAPYVLESTETPEEWLIYCENDLNTFFSKYGVTRCDHCDQSWEGELLRCPHCGERPATVAAEIKDLQDSHEGVLVMISPSSEKNVSLQERLQTLIGRLHQHL